MIIMPGPPRLRVRLSRLRPGGDLYRVGDLRRWPGSQSPDCFCAPRMRLHACAGRPDRGPLRTAAGRARVRRKFLNQPSVPRRRRRPPEEIASFRGPVRALRVQARSHRITHAGAAFGGCAEIRIRFPSHRSTLPSASPPAVGLLRVCLGGHESRSGSPGSPPSEAVGAARQARRKIGLLRVAVGARRARLGARQSAPPGS